MSMKQYVVAVGWEDRKLQMSCGADEITVTAETRAEAIGRAAMIWVEDYGKTYPTAVLMDAMIIREKRVTSLRSSSPPSAAAGKPRSPRGRKAPTTASSSRARGRSGTGRRKA